VCGERERPMQERKWPSTRRRLEQQPSAMKRRRQEPQEGEQCKGGEWCK